MAKNPLQTSKAHCIVRLLLRAFSIRRQGAAQTYRHSWRWVMLQTCSYGSQICKKGCGPIIGVSKRCCPPCQYLLSLLSTKGLPFIVRGSHNTVTACTLPGWLPMDIVDSMNKYFGDQLRRELVTLMDSSSFMRMRAQSNGSHRLSSDSTEVTNEALDLPKDYYNYDRRLWLKQCHWSTSLSPFLFPLSSCFRV